MDGTRLTGLWKNKSKAGETYLSGTLGLSKLLIMPNGFKRNEKDPDFYALLVPNEKKDAPKDAPTTPAFDDVGF